MRFKQAHLFELSLPLDQDPRELEKQLIPLAFTPCLPSLPISYGWVSPFDQEDAPLVQPINRHGLVCMQMEVKILPAVVVRQALVEKIKDIESTQDRCLST